MFRAGLSGFQAKPVLRSTGQMLVGPEEFLVLKRMVAFPAGGHVLVKLLAGGAVHRELPVADFELLGITLVEALTAMTEP